MPGITQLVSTPSAANAMRQVPGEVEQRGLGRRVRAEQRVGLARVRRRQLTIRPQRRACMMGMHASDSRTAEKKFCSKPCCQSSWLSLSSRRGWSPPALFTRMSTRPNSSVGAFHDLIGGRRAARRSTATVTARAPWALAFVPRLRRNASGRGRRARRGQPSAPRSAATCRPMPLARAGDDRDPVAQAEVHSISLRGDPFGVAHGQQLDQLAVGIPDEDGVAVHARVARAPRRRALDDLAAGLGMSSTLTETWVRPGSFMVRSRIRQRGGAGPGEVEQLEHEPVHPQVARGMPTGGFRRRSLSTGSSGKVNSRQGSNPRTST